MPRLDNGKQGYVQGDGIVCERNTRNVVIRRCQGSGMGDAESVTLIARDPADAQQVLRRAQLLVDG